MTDLPHEQHRLDIKSGEELDRRAARLKKSHTHETTLYVHDSTGKKIGEIDVRIQFAVISFGRPARVQLDEHDHPAEGAEIDVIHVEMLNAPKAGRTPKYIDAWDWLYDAAIDWANAHATELAATVTLDLQGRREAAE